jgi:hypothetical protein
MLNHVVAAIFLLVFVIGPTFAEMSIAADPMGSEISDESIKNWVREELAARDGTIEALQAQVAVRDERIEALLRRQETEQRDAPHLHLAHRQMQGTSPDNLAELDAIKICGMDSDDNGRYKIIILLLRLMGYLCTTSSTP